MMFFSFQITIVLFRTTHVVYINFKKVTPRVVSSLIIRIYLFDIMELSVVSRARRAGPGPARVRVWKFRLLSGPGSGPGLIILSPDPFRVCKFLLIRKNIHYILKIFFLFSLISVHFIQKTINIFIKK